MYKKEKGITIIALITTIVVLLIISGVTVSTLIQGVDESQDNKLWSELEIVQHAILERNTKYKLTKDKELLVGTMIEPDPLPDGKTWKLSQSEINGDVGKAYYELSKQDLDYLGLEAGSGDNVNIYIVNYYTGEVYNKTRQKTTDGTVLYITLKLYNE